MGDPRPPTTPAGGRQRVLNLLKQSDEAMSIAAIARRLDIHPNTARFHLESHAETGQVEQVDVSPTGRGRPPLLFRAPRQMDPTGPRNYRFLAEMLISGLADAVDPVARAMEIGRGWGLRTATPPSGGMTADEATSWMTELLAEVGFAPEPAVDGTIGVRNCPFLETVEPHDRLVCALHLGFMRGAAERAGDPVTVRRLLPFAEPDLCLVVLAPGRDTPEPPHPG